MSDSQSLNELPIGKKALVKAILAKGELGRRLRDMGLMPGTSLTLAGCAPLGDPLVVSLDGFDLSLRLSEAKQVLVEPLEAK